MKISSLRWLLAQGPATSNLISHEVFQSLFGRIIHALHVTSRSFYILQQRLQTLFAVALNVSIPPNKIPVPVHDIVLVHTCKRIEFWTVPGLVATLLGQELSEACINKVEIPVTSCNLNMTPQSDKKNCTES